MMNCTRNNYFFILYLTNKNIIVRVDNFYCLKLLSIEDDFGVSSNKSWEDKTVSYYPDITTSSLSKGQGMIHFVVVPTLL